MRFRIYLNDNYCGAVYWSDGTYDTYPELIAGSASHVKLSGKNPYAVSMNDAGGECTKETTRSVPRLGRGNYNVTVTITPAS